MRIFRNHVEVPVGARGAAVALGNFDGVHRGHEVVINAAGEQARRLGVPHGLVTFEPHPRQVLYPGGVPFRLTPFRSKALRMEALGVDVMFSLHFDSNFAMRNADDFVSEILLGALGVSHVTVGWDFVFGKGRAGDAKFLYDRIIPSGIGLEVIKAITAEDSNGKNVAVSSTRIREHLSNGEPKAAAQLLGRQWEIDGRVIKGDQRGRTLNFPTANLALGDFLIPKAGVYAVRVAIERDSKPLIWLDGVANIGIRPTVDGTVSRLEAHIFDFDEDIYGRHLRVALVDWIRPEQRFSGLDALKAQIALDAATAREILSRS